MERSGTLQPGPRRPTSTRVSDQDRDAVAQRLQGAFAEGRLDDGEFNERMRAALTARAAGVLDRLTVDLHAAADRPAGLPTGVKVLAGLRWHGRTRSAAAADGASPSALPRWCTTAMAGWTCAPPS